MPIVFCEGVDKGPDTLLLKKILTAPSIKIAAGGTSYGLAGRIRALRDHGPITQVYAMRDRGFDNVSEPPKQEPLTWEVKDNENLNFRQG